MNTQWIVSEVDQQIARLTNIKTLLLETDTHQGRMDSPSVAVRGRKPGMKRIVPAAAGLKTVKRKGGLSPQGRRRISEALKARHAAKKNAAQ
jgi:hypothetical protein